MGLVRTGGTRSLSSAATSTTIAVPSAGHLAGNTVLVAIMTNPGGNTVTVTDSKGNTYVGDALITNSKGLWRSKLATSLVSGDSITLTSDVACAWIAASAEFEGPIASPIDVALSSVGDATFRTTDSAPATGTLANADEIVVSGFFMGNAALSSYGSGWTGLGTVAISSSIFLAWEFQETSTTNSLTPTVTTTTSHNNVASFTVAYKVDYSLVAPRNLTLPSISGTPTPGNVLTVDEGTWANNVTGYTYQWQHGDFSLGYQDISDATSKTWTVDNRIYGRGVRCNVIANGSGGSSPVVNSAAVIPTTPRPPWPTRGNPWNYPLPADVPIDAAMTTTLQNTLQGWYTAGKYWFPEGGDWGASFSSILHVVDSSMPRTPWVTVGGFSVNYTVPKYAQVQNSTDQKSHMAWTFGVKNGGIPTPPGGFMQAPGTDRHCAVYCTDTYEYWEGWEVLFKDINDMTVHSDYRGQWTVGYAGYVPDVRYSPGFWETLDEFIDGNKTFNAWGAMATSLPYFCATIMQEEMLAGEIPHAIGILTPGSNGTARWPAQRSDAPGYPLPAGGIWQIDPSLDVESLPVGSLSADQINARTIILKALQNYGAIVCDSTLANLSFRFEATVTRLFTTGDHFSPLTVSGVTSPSNTMDLMIRQVPITAWRMIDASYRPPVQTGSWKVGLS